MERITVKKGSKRIIHVEAPGCVVNVRRNLKTLNGKQVTTVEIFPDRYAGEEWHLPEFPWKTNGVTLRVVEGKPPVDKVVPAGTLLQRTLKVLKAIELVDFTPDSQEPVILSLQETRKLHQEIETLLHHWGQL